MPGMIRSYSGNIIAEISETGFDGNPAHTDAMPDITTETSLTCQDSSLLSHSVEQMQLPTTLTMKIRTLIMRFTDKD